MTALEIKNYIFKNHKVEFLLESIGCQNIVYHANKDYYSCSNAVGGDCNNPTAINIRNTPYLNYRNFTRDVSYNDNEDIISLVQYNKSIDFKEAMKYIHKLFGLKYTFSKDKKEKNADDSWFIFSKYSSRCRSRTIVNDFEPMDEDVLTDFIPHIHIDLFREGIIAKTIKKFELGYSFKWRRSIFPVRYWLDGSLMGYNSRTSIENCEELGIKKYFITPGMKKEINLYGLWQNYSDIKKADYVTVFEAEKSVLKRDSLMDSTCVALQGHIMSDEQVRILLGLDVSEIVIAMDKDVPIEEVWCMCEKFYGIRKISYIYDQWDTLGAKDSPADAVSKLYKILFKHRKVYDKKTHEKYIRKINKH